MCSPRPRASGSQTWVSTESPTYVVKMQSLGHHLRKIQELSWIPGTTHCWVVLLGAAFVSQHSGGPAPGQCFTNCRKINACAISRSAHAFLLLLLMKLNSLGENKKAQNPSNNKKALIPQTFILDMDLSIPVLM